MSTYAYVCTKCPYKTELHEHKSIPFELDVAETDEVAGPVWWCPRKHVMRRDWQGGGNGVIVR